MTIDLVGYGWDLHRFKTSIKGYILLGGVKIESNKDIDAHSDGDLVFHALVDALLGAIAAGDIGDYFTSSDTSWKDKDSQYFLDYAYNLVKSRGYIISNIDITIINELTRIGAYKKLIKENVSLVLGISSKKVNVKAKTNDRLGYLGRKEAIETHVILGLTRINT